MTTKTPTLPILRVEEKHITPIDALLSKTLVVSSKSPSSEQVDGLQMGTLAQCGNGNTMVDIPSLGLSAVAAKSLVPVVEQDMGRQVVLGFEAGHAQRPIVLGFLNTPRPAAQVRGTEVFVESAAGRVVVQAEDELELRCGDAVILMQSDGRITLRGRNITSHASAGQRIRGGSVQIN